MPASACGLVGLKPTRGRINMWPSTEWLSPVSVQGFQTRTVHDLAACIDFASGSLPGDPMPPPDPARSYFSEVGADPGSLKIGLWNRLPATLDGKLDPECQRAVEETGKLLESFERKLRKKAGPDNLDPDTLFWLDRARGVGATEYLFALEDVDAFTRAFAGWWSDGGFDVLVTPVTGTLTPKLGALGMDAARLKTSALWWPFTAFFNMSGQPAISLPLHWSNEGLPVGVQLGTAYAREDVLIRLAAQLEQALPWSERIPPVHA